MAYDSTKPADDEYLSAFPAEAREQLRAIIEDQIVNALKLQGLVPGNSSGQLPVNNGNVNTNLNADQVDGKDASYFSPSTHIHPDATQNADGFMSKADKTKLDGVATGAEVNQNAFSNVAVGSITIQADGKQGTLTIAQGANITITADATNDKLTVAVSGTVPAANKLGTPRKIGGVIFDASADIDLPGVNKAGTQDTSGNSATSSKWQTSRTLSMTGDIAGNVSIDGSGDVSLATTAVDFTGATAAVNGTHGTVPKPSAGDQNKVLMGDGTWGSPTKQTLWGMFHSYAENYVPTDTSNAGWSALGLCIIYYTQNVLANQPGQYGQLINLSADSGNEACQIWISQPDGYMYTRSGNSSTAIDSKVFRRVAMFDSDANGHLKFPNGGEMWIS